MSITINVKPIMGNKTDSPAATKYQQPLSPSFNGSLLSITVSPNDTVMTLKKKVALLTLSMPELLMYSGKQMDDKQKLSAYGITSTMGIFDYVWVNSTDNQEQWKKDLHTHKDPMKTKYHYLREKFKGSCWSF